MTDTDRGVCELADWLADVSSVEWLWHAKYLSASDTYAKRDDRDDEILVGKALLTAAFPVFSRRAEVGENSGLTLHAVVDSHGVAPNVCVVWDQSRRDEARLTQWGGTDSPIVEAGATGSLVIFAYRVRQGADADAIRVWRCRSVAEEDHVLDIIPDVVPGSGRVASPMGHVLHSGR